MADKKKSEQKPKKKSEQKQTVEKRNIEKSEQNPPKKPKQKEISPPKGGRTTTTAGDESPLPPPPGADKKGVGKRGPDKAPRKPRKDKGRPKLSEDEIREKAKAEAREEAEAAAAVRARAELDARMRSARTLTNGFVVTGGVLLSMMLPPELSKAERDDLTEAWLPIVEANMDRLSPLLPPMLCTAAVVAPRAGAALGRRRARSRAWKQPDRAMSRS
jgi:hypothetical protein